MEENELGILFRKAREERGISIRNLARRLTISHTSLSRFETGKRSMEWETILKVADYLGIKRLERVFVIDRKAEVTCKRCLYRQTINF